MVVAATAAAAAVELDAGLKLLMADEHTTVEGMQLKLSDSEAQRARRKVKEIWQNEKEDDVRARKLNTMAASFVQDSDPDSTMELRNGNNKNNSNNRGTNRAKTKNQRNRNGGKNHRGKVRDARFHKNKKDDDKWNKDDWGDDKWNKDDWGDGWKTDDWGGFDDWTGKNNGFGGSIRGGKAGKGGRRFGGKGGKNGKSSSYDDWVDPWLDDWGHDDWVDPWVPHDDWGNGWNKWTHPPTFSPTMSPTLYPTFYPTISPTFSVSSGCVYIPYYYFCCIHLLTFFCIAINTTANTISDADSYVFGK